MHASRCLGADIAQSEVISAEMFDSPCNSGRSVHLVGTLRDLIGQCGQLIALRRELDSLIGSPRRLLSGIGGAPRLGEGFFGGAGLTAGVPNCPASQDHGNQGRAR